MELCFMLLDKYELNNPCQSLHLFSVSSMTCVQIDLDSQNNLSHILMAVAYSEKS